jgi:photosystem II stability/assembly factor-like uncharacterized protein
MAKIRDLFAALAGSVFLVSAVGATAGDPDARQQPGEGPSIDALRSAWFYGQRAYPHRYVPARAWEKASEQRDAMEAEALARHDRTTTFTWKLIGPKPIDTPYTDPIVAGRVTATAIDYTSTSTVYLAGAQGGVWKTTNAGTTWAPITDRERSLAIGSLAIDPLNHLTVYAGTGEENFSGDSYYGAGILKSTDGGVHWTQYCGPFCGPVGNDTYYGGGARVGSLAIDPNNTQVLLAGVALLNKNGIYRSNNGGKSWTQVLAGNPGTAVLFDPANGNIAYAAIRTVSQVVPSVFTGPPTPACNGKW